jgi:hypothetical protein
VVNYVTLLLSWRPVHEENGVITASYDVIADFRAVKCSLCFALPGVAVGNDQETRDFCRGHQNNTLLQQMTGVE